MASFRGRWPGMEYALFVSCALAGEFIAGKAAALALTALVQNSLPDSSVFTFSLSLTIDFQVNIDKTPSADVLKTLRKWCDLVYDPLTGRTGLKTEYVAPWMLITMYDRAARPFWQWKCWHVFPTTALPEPALGYQSEEIYAISGFGIAVDMWDETII